MSESTSPAGPPGEFPTPTPTAPSETPAPEKPDAPVATGTTTAPVPSHDGPIDDGSPLKRPGRTEQATPASEGTASPAVPPQGAFLASPFDAYAVRVIAPDDQVLFQEAVRCVRADALRAAYVMTWISAAESLKRKFRELAERDKKAAGVLQKVTDAEAQHQAVDVRLLNEAKAYGFISDAEHAQLLHVYQMRALPRSC